MHLSRTCVIARTLTVLALAGGALHAHAAGIDAAAYPMKPVRLIAAQPAGGNTDVVARLFAQQLSERFGRQLVVDNRGGAGGIIATEMVARAEPDGYTLLAVGSSFTANPAIAGKLPYDTHRDFLPLSLLASGPNVLVVGASHSARSVKDLLALARANPGKLNVASSGVATATHLCAELFKYLGGVDIQHVAYKGAPAAMVAVSSGESDLSFAGMSGALPLLRSGKLRALGVTTAKRWPNLSEVPTIAEGGVAGYDAPNWYGLIGPAKLPSPVVARLQREIADIAKMEAVRERLITDGLAPADVTPQEFQAHIEREIAKWIKLAKTVKIGTS